MSAYTGPDPALIKSLQATNFLGQNTPALGSGIAPEPSQLIQAMATFGTTGGALDTSSPLGQHNASATTGMLFATTGQSHP